MGMSVSVWRVMVALMVVVGLGWVVPSVAEAQEKVSVTVFELTAGDGVDAQERQTLSGVLRQEAQQHDGYALANSASLERGEIALIAGCDPDDVECVKTMGDYVDGQVLILGNVERQGDRMSLMVDVVDLRREGDPVQVQRIFDPQGDAVVNFRSQAEAIFDRLDSGAKTHLVVEAPGEGIQVYLDGIYLGDHKVERRGLEAGDYELELRQGAEVVYAERVSLEVGREVALRPSLESEQEAVAQGEEEEVEPDMEVRDRRVVPGEDGAAMAVEDGDYRSNMGAFSLMGMGMGSLVASGVMVALMRGVESDLNQESEAGTLTPDRHRELERRGESYEAAQYVLLGVGAVSIGAGVTWAMINHRRQDRGLSSVAPGMMVGSDYSGVRVRGRW